MRRFPKWTWAPSRFGVDRIESGGLASPMPSRPCLPSVEKLDPRTLFSVSISDISIVKYIDKSSPTLAIAESDVLAPVQGATTDSNYKGEVAQLGNEFYKLNDILLKYEDDILSQKVAANEAADVTESLSLNFGKIEYIATALDGGTGALLPAVQKVYELAIGTDQSGQSGPSILSSLSDLANQIKLSPYPDAEADVLAKMAGDFYKLGEVALDYKLDLIDGVPTDVALKQATYKEQTEYIKLKLEEVLVSGYLSEADQSGLNEAVDGAFNLVNGAINPSTAGNGPTVPSVTGDAIL